MSVAGWELKKRYEAGDVLNKTLQRRVTKELKRFCKLPDCDKSLAFRTAQTQFCNAAHRLKNERLVVKKNKLKKKRFNERHGIKYDKTIRNRDSKPSAYALKANTGKEWDGTPLIYANYKEPLKKIEKGKGFGYYGTIAVTADNDYVQCHVCGNLYSSVGAHLRTHKVTAEKYKEIYGLAATACLMGEEARENLQAKVVSQNISKEKGLPKWLKDYNKKVQSGEVKHPGSKRKEGGMSLQKRNELGICPDQVLERIRDLADKLGYTPSQEEFAKHYKYKYVHSIAYQHGSWSNAVRKLGMRTRREMRSPNSETLIEDLVEFHKQHGRIPMTSDFNRGLLRDRGVYIRVFGSLNNARLEAGLNAVLPLPFGQVVEMTADQYREYKLGGNPLSFGEPHQRNGKKKSYKKKVVA